MSVGLHRPLFRRSGGSASLRVYDTRTTPASPSSNLSLTPAMRRFRPALLVAIAGILGASVLSACNKADAAAGAAAASAAAKPATPAAAGTTVALTASGDSLTDSTLIFRADRGRLLGAEKGTVWVVMISDFQCPYCKTWHDAAMDNLKRDYVNGGKVRMAYLNLPLPQHKHARAEAEAALCAGTQGKFWPYSDSLFAHQAEVATLATVQPLLESIGKQLSLDMGEFGRCQKRDAIKSLVESDIQQASKAGVQSTPSFLVGDFMVQGAVPYADFRKAIDTALVLANAAAKKR